MNIYLKILNSYQQSQISDLNLLRKTQLIDTLCGGIGHCFFFFLPFAAICKKCNCARTGLLWAGLQVGSQKSGRATFAFVLEEKVGSLGNSGDSAFPGGAGESSIISSVIWKKFAKSWVRICFKNHYD